MSDFNFSLSDYQDEASWIRAVSQGHKNPAGPTKTSRSMDPTPRAGLVEPTLADAMSGMILYKPPGATYDLFNQQLSHQLEGLKTEDNPNFSYKEKKLLSPYDIFVGQKNKTGEFGLSSVDTNGVLNNAAQIGQNVATGTINPNGEIQTGTVTDHGMIYPLEGGKQQNFISQPWHLPGGHPGIDLVGHEGAKILAAKGGQVVQVPNDQYKGGGNVVFINHGDGQWTTYMHCSAYMTQNNVQVEQGQVVALVGHTGYATGPHLHFEVHEGVPKTDPYPRFSTAFNVNPNPYIGL